LSLMAFQMIRVISSPSSSTTGFATLILAIDSATFRALETGGTKAARARRLAPCPVFRRPSL
jgi:hypothetical protein